MLRNSSDIQHASSGAAALVAQMQAAVQKAKGEAQRQATMTKASRQASVQEADGAVANKAAAQMALKNLKKLSYNELVSVATELWPAVTGYVFKIGCNIGKQSCSKDAWRELIRFCQQHGADRVITFAKQLPNP